MVTLLIVFPSQQHKYKQVIFSVLKSRLFTKLDNNFSLVAKNFHQLYAKLLLKYNTNIALTYCHVRRLRYSKQQQDIFFQA